MKDTLPVRLPPSPPSPPSAPTAPAVPQPVAADPLIAAAAVRLPAIQGKTPGERINFLHRLAEQALGDFLAAAVYAGWELARVSAALPHGAWSKWLADNTALPYRTAHRYIVAYSNSLAHYRASLPTPVSQDTPPTGDELAAAIAETGAKTLSELTKAPREGWGGAREGAGRKAKSETETTDPSLLAQESLMEAGKSLAALDRILGPGGGAYLWNMAALKELKANLLRLADWTEAIIAARAGGGR